MRSIFFIFLRALTFVGLYGTAVPRNGVRNYNNDGVADFISLPTLRQLVVVAKGIKYIMYFDMIL